MKIAVYGRTFSKEFDKYANELFNNLKRNGVRLSFFEPFHDFLSKQKKMNPDTDRFFTKESGIDNDIDFMFSIGGDGTFLETIPYVVKHKTPLVGINSGRLGFLANISKEGIAEALDAIFHGQYSFEERAMVQLETPCNLFGEDNYALNELTIFKKDTTAMITIHTYINNVYLNSYWGDGLIIATPTGSTAYSLSVGGPIVLPDSSNFIISPIAPHSLTVRPMVIPDKSRITLKVEGRGGEFLASLDHRTEVFDSTVHLSVSRADSTVNIVKFNSTNFFSTLRNKLMWGVDKRN
ncbi:MAG: NAD kinase [Bacteroidetes bacterium]|nr:NAD kinase [Bacteroidota bacterium]